MFRVHVEFHGAACSDYRERHSLVSYIGDFERSIVSEKIYDEASVQICYDSFCGVAHHNCRADKRLLCFGVYYYTFKNVSGFFRSCDRFLGRDLAEKYDSDGQNKFQFSHYASFFLFPAAKVW